MSSQAHPHPNQTILPPLYSGGYSSCLAAYSGEIRFVPEGPENLFSALWWSFCFSLCIAANQWLKSVAGSHFRVIGVDFPFPTFSKPGVYFVLQHVSQ